MKTIVIADALMGIDNVLVVAGLLISVPIVVWGSTLVLKLVDRFPVITYPGAAVLAYTAAHMILSEALRAGMLKDQVVRVIVYVVAIAGVLAAGRWASQRQAVMSPASS